MKAVLKKLIPPFLMDAYVQYCRKAEDRRNSNRSNEEVFGEIYRERKWSDNKSATETYCSGTGSTTETIVEPYVKTMVERLKRFSERPRVVDLGCGDFRVGSRLVPYCQHYTAVDVVPDLINHLRTQHTQSNLQFMHLDITRDPLPDGDVCLIRQVFQHLSNSQIEAVMAKLSEYSRIFITEHHPEDSPTIVPNLDKVHGSAIRLFKNSGVFLDKPPFDRYVSECRLILEVPGHSFNRDASPGLIRTFELTPSSRE
jgi:SAM-dependent methyltransferase